MTIASGSINGSGTFVVVVVSRYSSSSEMKKTIPNPRRRAGAVSVLSSSSSSSSSSRKKKISTKITTAAAATAAITDAKTNATRRVLSASASTSAVVAMMTLSLAQPVEAAQVTNYLAAGNFSFLEREYGDLAYTGVSEVDVGTCDGKQCVKVTYDDEKVPFERIMRVYFKHFDPKNASKGQYSEVGDQYKPAVYINSEKERTYVNDSLDKLERSKVFGKNLPDNWVSNIPVLDAQSVKFEREPDDGKRNTMKKNPKSLEKLSKARDAQFDQLWGFVQFCYERVCGYVRFAPACVGECQEVFPEFLSRNSGVPELEGDVRITGGTYKA